MTVATDAMHVCGGRGDGVGQDRMSREFVMLRGRFWRWDYGRATGALASVAVSVIVWVEEHKFGEFVLYTLKGMDGGGRCTVEKGITTVQATVAIVITRIIVIGTITTIIIIIIIIITAIITLSWLMTVALMPPMAGPLHDGGFGQEGAEGNHLHLGRHQLPHTQAFLWVGLWFFMFIIKF